MKTNDIVIRKMLENYLASNDMLVSTSVLLQRILDLLPECSTIKYDATVSVASQVTDTNALYAVRILTANDSNVLAYEDAGKHPSCAVSEMAIAANLRAIYFALTTLVNLRSFDSYVEVRCSSFATVDYLNDDPNIFSEYLADRLHGIHKLIQQYSLKVDFVWRPVYFDADMQEVHRSLECCQK